MLTLFITALLLCLVVFGFRWQRRREIDAFMDADLAEIRSAVRPASVEGAVPAASLRAVAPGEADAGPPQEPPVAVRDGVERASAEWEQYQLRAPLFDEVTRSFLLALDQVLDRGYRAFIKVPVRELVKRVAVGASAAMDGERQVSVIICRREDFSLICGVQLADGSEQSRRQLAELRELFKQLERPLLSFPLATDYSPVEIRERMGELVPRGGQVLRFPRGPAPAG